MISGLPAEVDAARALLFKSGLLLPSGTINYNPYPKIGSIGKGSAAGSKGYPANRQEYSETYKYPRITQDC